MHILVISYTFRSKVNQSAVVIKGTLRELIGFPRRRKAHRKFQ